MPKPRQSDYAIRLAKDLVALATLGTKHPVADLPDPTTVTDMERLLQAVEVLTDKHGPRLMLQALSNYCTKKAEAFKAMAVTSPFGEGRIQADRQTWYHRAAVEIDNVDLNWQDMPQA